MSTKRRSELINLVATVAAQIPPLGAADQAYVARAMAAVAPDWVVEMEGICADEATLVVVPEDGEDATGPSFVISRETYGLRVDQVHWDGLAEVGVFASLSDVVSALEARLAFCAARAAPFSVTLH
jgi:hypothetical protein